MLCPRVISTIIYSFFQVDPKTGDGRVLVHKRLEPHLLEGSCVRPDGSVDTDALKAVLHSIKQRRLTSQQYKKEILQSIHVISCGGQALLYLLCCGLQLHQVQLGVGSEQHATALAEAQAATCESIRQLAGVLAAANEAAVTDSDGDTVYAIPANVNLPVVVREYVAFMAQSVVRSKAPFQQQYTVSKLHAASHDPVLAGLCDHIWAGAIATLNGRSQSQGDEALVQAAAAAATAACKWLLHIRPDEAAELGAKLVLQAVSGYTRFPDDVPISSGAG